MKKKKNIKTTRKLDLKDGKYDNKEQTRDSNLCINCLLHVK